MPIENGGSAYLILLMSVPLPSVGGPTTVLTEAQSDNSCLSRSCRVRCQKILSTMTSK